MGGLAPAHLPTAVGSRLRKAADFVRQQTGTASAVAGLQEARMTGCSCGRVLVRVAAVLPFALAAAAGCGESGGGGAAVVSEPVWHMETAKALVGPDLEVAAVDYVRSLDGELGLGLSAEDDFEITRIVESEGLRHVRLQQTFAGLPVMASQLVVHADEHTFIGVNGRVTKNLEGFDITTTVSDADAMATSKVDLAGDTLLEYSDEASRMVILPKKEGGASIAWHVSFGNAAGGGIETGEWNYFIDARAGTVLRKFDGHTTIEQGSGPGGNAKVTRTWSSQLDVELDDDVYKMNTDDVRTEDRSDGDDVFESAELGNFTDREGNDAHGFAEVTLDMMRNWMGRDSLDDDGYKIVSRVHDTKKCSGAPMNACFSGGKMYYGDGGGDFLPFSGGLDIVAHELNHGFTRFHSDLDYEDQSGGLNESFSDVAGTVAEFYDEGASADFDIGEDIMVGDEPLRRMCNQSLDGWSADDAGDYYEGMDPHGSSGVPNRAFCLAVGRYRAVGSGYSTIAAVRAVGHIWYTANAAYWTSGTTYQEGCRGIVDAARVLGHGSEVVEALAASWADVGVVCETDRFVCDDDGDCDTGDGETCGSCAEDCGSCAQDCSWWQRALCEDGVGDCSQCSDDSGCGDHFCDGDETDENCGEDCGCGALQCEDIAPYGCWCDPSCEDIGDCCADRGDVCD
jgi:Zn-dependent metalloprotease